MIASIAERAKAADPPVEVIVYRGPRRLPARRRPGPDHDHLARDHRHPGVRPRRRDRPLRDPPGAGPRLHRAQGGHERQHPGRPGIGDKTAADLLQRFGSLEGVLDSVEEISGAKRKENLTNHADDARVSKQLATAKRDIPLDSTWSSSSPRAGPLAAARGFPRVRAARAAAPARGGAGLRRRRGAGARRRQALQVPACERREGWPTSTKLPADAEVALAVQPAGRPRRGRSPAKEPRVALRCLLPRSGGRLLARSPVRGPRICAGARRPAGGRPRREGARHRSAQLGHDTEVGAYLLEPARRAYPFRELCEERGVAHRGGRNRGRGRSPTRSQDRRPGPLAARGDTREGAHRSVA